jgi:catechol 2,3-dioxygenase-like lactoylglutathione lyase family enzyme
MKIKAIAHVCLKSRDLKKAMAFYHALGCRIRFKFVNSKGDVKGCYLQVSDSSFIEIFENPSVTNAAGTIAHFCLEVDDIKSCATRLKNAGIDVTEPKLGADHSYQCWATDPDGNKIEFHEYTPKSAQKTGKDCVINW